jgi:hypothetical protein
MFRPRDVFIGLALEYFEKNIQIVFTGNEMSFVTQYFHKLRKIYIV